MRISVFRNALLIVAFLACLVSALTFVVCGLLSGIWQLVAIGIFHIIVGIVCVSMVDVQASGWTELDDFHFRQYAYRVSLEEEMGLEVDEEWMEMQELEAEWPEYDEEEGS